MFLFCAERGGGGEAGEGWAGFRPAGLCQGPPGTGRGPQRRVLTCCSAGTPISLFIFIIIFLLSYIIHIILQTISIFASQRIMIPRTVSRTPAGFI